MTTKRKFFIYILIFIACYSAIIIFIIIPTIKDIREISQTIYNERVDLEKKYLKGQLMKKTLEDFEKIKSQEEKLFSIFVIKGQELAFITLLEDFANKNNIELKINLKQIQTEAKISSIPLELSLSGNYLNTLKYLDDLERLNNYYGIKNIQISSYQQNIRGNVKLIVKGDIYTTEPETF